MAYGAARPASDGAAHAAELPRPITSVLRQLDPSASVRPGLPHDPLRFWATSGAMWLSGPPGGRLLAAPGCPAQVVALALELLHTEAPTARTALPGPGVLGERAALRGLGRGGSRSCGGSAHLLRARDAHVAISLARDDDTGLLPALLSAPVGADPLRDLTAWAAGTPASDVADRAQLLGIAAAVVPAPDAAADDRTKARSGRTGAAPALVTPGGEARRDPARPPLVVDLSSLWAGPLCAHLLGLLGAEVVKVESPSRLDGARRGSPAFYRLLHGGHQSVVVDFRTAEGVARLTDLLCRADLVIEASRPRALAQLGINPVEFVERGTVWLSITAYGRTGPWSNRVGFGDDVAAGAGMVGWADGEPCFLGDALADPMTGVVAALLAKTALARGRGCLLDISMRDVVACSLGPIPEHDVGRGRDGRWWISADGVTYEVLPPRPRTTPRTAPAPGKDNDRWLGAA